MLIYTPIEKCKTVICSSPKCACQTISRLTLRIFTHPFFNTYHLGAPSANPDYLKAQQKQFTTVVDPSFKKIITTRHPLKRILSCYNYMILGLHSYTQAKSGEKWFKSPIEKFTGRPLCSTTFTEFIDYILKTPDNLRDIHFSTQSFLAEDINFDKIIRLENFIEDFENAITDLKLPVVLPKQIQRNKTNYAHFNTSELTEEILEKIYTIYEQDFKKFHYAPISLREIKDYINSKSIAGPVHQGRLTHKSREFKNEGVLFL